MKVLNGFFLALVISVASTSSYAAFEKGMCDGVLADEVALSLKAGQTPEQIAEALKQIAEAAKTAGVDVQCLVNALIDAEQDPDAVQAALVAAGYDKDAVAVAVVAATKLLPVTSPQTSPETGGGVSNT